ncbi:MAG: CARDB domain-containing protein [Candidatus Cloacimonadia bacterium]
MKLSRRVNLATIGFFALFIGLISISLYGQVLLDEDFSSASFPSGWINDSNDNEFLWEFNNPANRIITGNFDEHFAIIDPAHYGHPNIAASLITQPIDCSSASGISLVFDHQYRHWSGSRGYLSISIDGATWEALDEFSQDIGEGSESELATYDITSFAAGERSVYIRWSFVGIAYWWAIDNVKVLALNDRPLPAYLIAPADNSYYNHTDTLLEWGSIPFGPEALGYNLYLDTTFPPTELVYTGLQTAFSPDLVNDQTYYWQVIPYNSEGVTESSICPIWSFTTNPAEPLPAKMLAPANDATHLPASTTFSWEYNLGELPTGYKLYLGTVSPPTELIYNGTEAEYTTTLDFATDYYWQVIPYNSAGSADHNHCPIWRFSTTTATPQQVALLSPPDQKSSVPVYTPLQWEPSNIGTPASGFRVYLDRVNPPAELVYDGIDVEYRPNLNFATTYYWQVIPYNEYGAASTDTAIIRSFTTANSYSLPFEELFSIDTVSPDWQNFDELGGNYAWQFDNPYSRNIGGNFDEHFAIADKASISDDATFTLISPALNCEDATQVLLTFEHQHRASAYTLPTLSVSIDGINWSNIDELTTDIGYPNPPIISQYNLTPIAANESTLYIRWRYEATNTSNGWWAIDNISVVASTAPHPVVNLSPKDGAKNVLLDTPLNWADSPLGMPPSNYLVYFDTLSPPEVIIQDDSLTIANPNKEFSTTYYWRVIPYNSSGSPATEECSIWSFTTCDPEPLCASVVEPADGELNVPTEVTLKWEPSSQGEPPIGYYLYFGTATTPTELIYSGSDNYFELDIEENTTYYWRVIPYNDYGATPVENTPIWSFTTIQPPISSGTYTVSQTPNVGDYLSIQKAVDDLTARGIRGDGDVTIEIEPGTYIEQIQIGLIPGTDADSKVIFTSKDSPANTIITSINSNSWNPYVIRLNRAKHIQISNLTIKSNEFTTYHWGIHLFNNCEHITISECLFDDPHGSFYHIIASSSTSNINEQGNNVNNLLIERNNFTNGYIALSIYGKEDLYSQGVCIHNNKFNDLRYAGVILSYVDSFCFDSNLIEMNVSGDTMNKGIYLEYTKGAFKFTNNRIIKARAYGIEWGSYNVFITSGGHINDGETAIFANNMIGGGFTYSSNWTAGIIIHAPVDNIGFYFNSFNMDQPNATYTQSCLFIRTSSATNIDLLNNSFAYTGGGSGYALYVANPQSLRLFNYNNYYSNGTRFVWLGSHHINLGSLQTSDGKNANSRVGNPKYTSPTELHSNGGQLYRGGLPIAGIEHDIDGDLRDSEAPNIGADEYEPILDNDLAAISIEGPNLIGTGSTSTFTVTIQNSGQLPQENFLVQLIRRDNIVLNTFFIDQTINPGQKKTFNIEWTPTVNGIYFLYCKTSLESDENPYNDSSPYLGVFVTTINKPQVSLTIDEAAGTCTLTWNPIASALSYKIYGSDSPHPESWGEPLANTSQTFYTTPLSTMQFFRVIATTDPSSSHFNPIIEGSDFVPTDQ